jgi:hypothetical protein
LPGRAKMKGEEEELVIIDFMDKMEEFYLK